MSPILPCESALSDFYVYARYGSVCLDTTVDHVRIRELVNLPAMVNGATTGEPWWRDGVANCIPRFLF